MYGYAQLRDGSKFIGFLNGVVGQVIQIDHESGCTSLRVREFDMNENKINTWEVHVMQVRKV